MGRFCISLLITFCLYECIPCKLSPENVCSKSPRSSRTLKLSVNSRKNESSEWVDAFTALAEFSNSANRMDVDLTHTVFECDNKRSIFIQGINNDKFAARTRCTPQEKEKMIKQLQGKSREMDRHLAGNEEMKIKRRGFSKVPTSATEDDPLHFHVRCGKNAAILDKGRTAQKINIEDPFNSQLFTHRPLRNGELFQVQLDKKNTKFNYCLGIGIIMRSADSVDILPEMFKSPVTLIYHHGNIYSTAIEKLKNYGKDINQLQVGDKIGVMRSELGTLHFFVNGVDQGPAASNIPSSVYGLVELWYNAMKVSIVNS